MRTDVRSSPELDAPDVLKFFEDVRYTEETLVRIAVLQQTYLVSLEHSRRTPSEKKHGYNFLFWRYW